MSAETKWTPGKWKPVFTKNGYAYGIKSNAKWRNKVIGAVGCDLFISSGCSPFRLPSSDEAIANAHLMATAPDLYAALEELLRKTVFEDEHNGLANDFGNNFTIASEALSKARGER